MRSRNGVMFSSVCFPVRCVCVLYDGVADIEKRRRKGGGAAAAFSVSSKSKKSFTHSLFFSDCLGHLFLVLNLVYLNEPQQLV